MPRPKSDLVKRMYTVSPQTDDHLARVARARGWLTESGEPNRSRAVRELAARAAARIKDDGLLDSGKNPA
jgi:hypothetical protein